MKSPLDVYSDLSEQLHYNFPDLRIYFQKGYLSHYGYAATCHWHPDLEFIFVLDGSMDFYINGEIVRLNSNCGVFVNSNRLHYGFSSMKKECIFIEVVIHPVLLHQNIPVVKSYYEERFSPKTNDFIVIKPDIQWQKDMIHLMKNIQREMNSEKKNLLNLLAYAVSMGAQISENLKENKESFDSSFMNQNTFKMVDFIHRNYADNISIEDIASSGGVCRSKCCKLFNKVIGQTPNSYLKCYRISKSCQLLIETSRSISEIAENCGFQSSSYFIAVFKKEMGVSPQKYRKQIS